MILFFGLYLGVANNRSLARFVRWNAMQVRWIGINYSYVVLLVSRLCILTGTRYLSKRQEAMHSDKIPGRHKSAHFFAVRGMKRV